MEKKDLQLISGTIVYESKLSIPAKLQLLNWIKESASEAQIKALLLDGVIAILDEQAEEIVNARFEQHHLNEGGWKSAAGIFLFGIYWPLYRALRATFDEKSKKCGVFGIGRKRDVCLWKLRAEQKKKEAGIFKRSLAKCGQHADPENCKAKTKEVIAKALDKAKQFENKISKYSAKAPAKGIKAQAGLKKAASPQDTHWT